MRTAWVAHRALKEMIAEADAQTPCETGGLLLGYRHSPQEVVITAVIGPGPAASHQRAGFHPDSRWQSAEIARRYAEAGRRLRYLGDWHTHPRGAGRLSRTDRRTLCTIARDTKASCPHPVMAVLAGGDPWRLVIHQSGRRLLHPARLQQLQVHPYDPR